MIKINHIVCVYLCFGLLPCVSQSQNSILNIRVSVNFSPNNLRELLNSITKQSNVHFQFSNNNIENHYGKSNRIDLREKTIKEVLDIALRETDITYTVFQNQILLGKPTYRNKYTIRGFVQDKITQKSIAGACVYIPGIRKKITTNSFGFYSITLPEMDSVTFIFLSFGYIPITKRIKLPKLSLLDTGLYQMQTIGMVSNRLSKIDSNTQNSILDRSSAYQKLKPTLKEVLLIVSVTNEKEVMQPDQEIFFESEMSGKVFSGITNENGQFELLVPKGDVYKVKYKTITHDADYTILDIPANESELLSCNVVVHFQMPKQYALDNVYFETGKASIQSKSYQYINKMVDYLRIKKKTVIEIGGHTDNVGGLNNLTLSQERANAVRNYLIEKGIEANRVMAKGYGYARPIDKNTTEEGRRKNRRVEVKIIR
jgi:outer membrane protein OmpA-like peptidoglycan-associated protein